MVEQLAVNQRVVGSSPTSGAIFFFLFSFFWAGTDQYLDYRIALITEMCGSLTLSEIGRA